MNAHSSKVAIPPLNSVSAHRPLVLGLGGTFRERSSTERALEVALSAAEEAGARVERMVGKQLMLPLYDPTEKARSCESRNLIALFERCDGLIVASPSYHGSISGTIKNALDYTEDMFIKGIPYLDGKAFGCIGCGSGWQGAIGALTTLRSIAHALRAWPSPLGVAVNTSQSVFGNDDKCKDVKLHEQLETIGRQVVAFAHAQHSLRESATPRSTELRLDALSAKPAACGS